MILSLLGCGSLAAAATLILLHDFCTNLLRPNALTQLDDKPRLVPALVEQILILVGMDHLKVKGTCYSSIFPDSFISSKLILSSSKCPF